MQTFRFFFFIRLVRAHTVIVANENPVSANTSKINNNKRYSGFFSFVTFSRIIWIHKRVRVRCEFYVDIKKKKNRTIIIRRVLSTRRTLLRCKFVWNNLKSYVSSYLILARNSSRTYFNGQQFLLEPVHDSTIVYCAINANVYAKKNAHRTYANGIDPFEIS